MVHRSGACARSRGNGVRSGGEEKTLLTKYFMASKIADNMTLANIATVAFDPKADGQMGSFSIVSISEEKITRSN